MGKIYTSRKKVTYDMHSALGDEQIKRQLAQIIIRDMEIDDLNKLFSFLILDPRSDECTTKLINHSTSNEYEREQIVFNMKDQTVLYEATIRIPDDPK